MKKLTAVLCLVLLVTAVVFPTAVMAQGTIEYEYSNNGDGTCTITNYIGTDANVVIPDSIDGLTVKAIGELAFADMGLKSVTFPQSINKIGAGAFMYNKLQSVDIPAGVTKISEAAFSFNLLKSVNIPYGVTQIRYGAFSCNKLKSVTIPNSVTYIGLGAFSVNQLKSVTIPSSVTYIGFCAFYENNPQFKTLTLPANTGKWISYDGYEFAGGNDVTVANGYYRVNKKPGRKEGVPAEDSAVIGVNNEYTLDLSTIFEDGNGDELAFEVSMDGGDFQSADKNFAYTPMAVGETVFVFKTNDGSLESEDTYTLTLSAVNYVPDRVDGVDGEVSASVVVKTVYSLDLTTIFKDDNGDALSYAVSVDGGDFAVANASYTYTPATVGETVLTFKSNDGIEDSVELYVVTLTATNTAPDLQDGVDAKVSASVVVKTAYTVDLATIFKDDNGDALSYAVSVDGGDFAVADASYTYTPATVGETVLTFKSNDGIEDSVQTYVVTLTATNTAPELQDGVDAEVSASVVVKTAYTVDLTTIFKDDNGDALSYAVSIDGGDFADANASYTYTPATVGETVLTFKANDGIEDSVELYVVTLTATNTAPDLQDGVDGEVSASVVVKTAYTVDLATIFKDDNGDALTYAVSIDGGDFAVADASYTYTPATVGETVLTFKANDGIEDSVELYVVTLTATNTAPDRKDGVDAEVSASVVVKTAYTVDLTTIFKDDNGDALTYKVSVDGGAFDVASASYTYTPMTAGETVLTFKANDGIENSVELYVVTLTVTNTAPDLKDGVDSEVSASVVVKTAYTVDLTTIFKDDNGDALTYKVSVDGGDFAVANANYTYTPMTAGEKVLTFKANDGTSDSVETYVVTLTVINTVPGRAEGAESEGSAVVEVNEAYTIQLSGIFNDGDGDALNYKVSINGGDYIVASVSYEYTPTTDGDTVLTFKANDGTDDSLDTYVFTLTAEYRMHTITYEPNGGDGYMAMEIFLSNTLVSLKGKSFVGSRDGLVAMGWNTRADGKGAHYDFGQEYLVPTYDVVLYGEWHSSVFDINYELCGGTNNPGNKDTYSATDTPVRLLAPTKEGFEFYGWYDNKEYTGEIITEIEEGSTGDKELWARWVTREVINDRYILTFYRWTCTKEICYVYYGDNDSTGIKNRCKYDETGLLTEMTAFNTAGERTTMTKYYANGKAQYKYYYDTATNKRKSMMSYNEAGVQIAKTEYYPDGINAKKQYFYYANGNKKLVKTFRTNKNLQSQVWFFEDGVTRKQYNTYDVNGKLVSVSKYYKNGTRYYHVKY